MMDSLLYKSAVDVIGNYLSGMIHITMQLVGINCDILRYFTQDNVLFNKPVFIQCNID